MALVEAINSAKPKNIFRSVTKAHFKSFVVHYKFEWVKVIQIFQG